MDICLSNKSNNFKTPYPVNHGPLGNSIKSIEIKWSMCTLIKFSRLSVYIIQLYQNQYADPSKYFAILSWCNSKIKVSWMSHMKLFKSSFSVKINRHFDLLNKTFNQNQWHISTTKNVNPDNDKLETQTIFRFHWSKWDSRCLPDIHPQL